MPIFKSKDKAHQNKPGLAVRQNRHQDQLRPSSQAINIIKKKRQKRRLRTIGHLARFAWGKPEGGAPCCGPDPAPGPPHASFAHGPRSRGVSPPPALAGGAGTFGCEPRRRRRSPRALPRPAAGPRKAGSEDIPPTPDVDRMARNRPRAGGLPAAAIEPARCRAATCRAARCRAAHGARVRPVYAQTGAARGARLIRSRSLMTQNLATFSTTARAAPRQGAARPPPCTSSFGGS